MVTATPLPESWNERHLREQLTRSEARVVALEAALLRAKLLAADADTENPRDVRSIVDQIRAIEVKR